LGTSAEEVHWKHYACCQCFRHFRPDAVGTVDGLEPFPFGGAEVAKGIASTLADVFIRLNAFKEEGVLLPKFVEATEATEGALAFEGGDVGDQVFRRPLHDGVAVDYVFTELAQVIALASVHDLYDGKILANARSPLGSEAATVNPSGVNESVDVKVPSSALISNFKRIESSAPILSECSTP
jgi:hypothetical protein